jgi:hypothetical protein
MDRNQASALADLQMHWDEAYVITLDGNIWCARYRTSPDELRAHTSSELRELIRSDYAYRQKADLIAYDPDGDDGAGADDDGAGADDDGAGADDDGAGADDDEAVAGHRETGGDGTGERRQDQSDGRRSLEVGNFATIRGEHMSL